MDLSVKFCNSFCLFKVEIPDFSEYRYVQKVDDRVEATERTTKLKPKIVKRQSFAGASFGSVED